MTEQERKKGGGSKLSRSETVTVRLDPKLRYLAELAARKHRRTLSSFIEWAIEDALSKIIIYEDERESISIAAVASNLWDVDDADRLVKLAINYPDLLTHDEQILWKLIRENGSLWRGSFDKNNEWSWNIKESAFIFERLRNDWVIFKAVAEGFGEKNILPTWLKTKDEEPEIPF